MWEVFYLPLLLVLSIAIAVEDFKTRLIDLWLLCLYSLGLVADYFIQGGSFKEFLDNLLFSCSYFLLMYLALQLYFFISKGSFVRIMDDKLGWADVWIAFSIALTVEPLPMITFFAGSILISLVVHIVFFFRQGSCPLAGGMTLVFFTYCLIQRSQYAIAFNY